MNNIPKVRHRLPQGRRLQLIDLRKVAGSGGLSLYAVDGKPGLWRRAEETNTDAIRVCFGLSIPCWLCRATEAEAEIAEAMKAGEPSDV